MTPPTATEMLRYAKARNAQVGRRTDFLSWIRVWEDGARKSIHVGAEVLAPGIVVRCGGTAIVANRSAALKAIGITLTGPVVIENEPVEILYQRPLAVVMNPDDPLLAWYTSLRGRVTMNPPDLNDVDAVVANPKDFSERMNQRLVSIPLQVCIGDRVRGIAELVHDLIGDVTIGVVVEADMFTSYGGICPYYLAKEWEPSWVDDFLPRL